MSEGGCPITRNASSKLMDRVYAGVAKTAVMKAKAHDGASTPDEDPPEVQAFALGTKLECNYMDSGNWYEGVVAKVNADDTFDVDYDDGDEEKAVSRVRLRLIGSSLPSGQPVAGKFRLGQCVNARYRGRDKRYPGVIVADHGDGTYDVDYDDGEQENRVSSLLIDSAEGLNTVDGDGTASLSTAAPSKGTVLVLAVGTRIECNYKDSGNWYPGEIANICGQDTFDVDYDDGDSEGPVGRDRIRLLGGTGDAVAAPASEPVAAATVLVLAVGTRIECNYKDSGNWYPGVIANICGQDTFDVDYDDGDSEGPVGRDRIRLLGGTGDAVAADTSATVAVVGDASAITALDAGATIADSDAEAQVQTEVYRLADKVEGLKKDGSKWLAGMIFGVNQDGTYDIEYADEGVLEKRLSPTRLRRPARPRRQSGTESGLAVGDKVKARVRGGQGQPTAGEIVRDCGDGTFDVDIKYGKRELGLKVEYIELVLSAAAAAAANAAGLKAATGVVGDDIVLETGTRIECNYKDSGNWYPGEIANICGQDTFDVDYDDGDSEGPVGRDRIRLLGGTGEVVKFAVGDKVKANYKGLQRAYPGIIAAVHGDGTYHVDYDDGEQEERVSASQIELVSAASPTGIVEETAPVELVDAGALTIGVDVECNYKSSGGWYPGEIARIAKDGTYGIQYDDGEREVGVGRHRIRLPEQPAAAPGEPVVYRDGDQVECDYRASGSWYPGTVSRVRTNGSCDVDYDDGEQELKIPPVRMRLVLGATSAKANHFSVGDRVKAKYQGERYYMGVISSDNGNGAFNVAYDDGETESNVPASLIVPAVEATAQTAASLETGSVNFDLVEGMTVECNYKNSGNWYGGKISGVPSYGTYDVAYDDGEAELRVSAYRVRAVRCAVTQAHSLSVVDAIYANAASSVASKKLLEVDAAEPTVEAKAKTENAIVEESSVIYGDDFADDDEGETPPADVAVNVDAATEESLAELTQLAALHAPCADVDHPQLDVTEHAEDSFIRDPVHHYRDDHLVLSPKTPTPAPEAPAAAEETGPQASVLQRPASKPKLMHEPEQDPLDAPHQSTLAVEEGHHTDDEAPEELRKEQMEEEREFGEARVLAQMEREHRRRQEEEHRAREKVRAAKLAQFEAEKQLAQEAFDRELSELEEEHSRFLQRQTEERHVRAKKRQQQILEHEAQAQSEAQAFQRELLELEQKHQEFLENERHALLAAKEHGEEDEVERLKAEEQAYEQALARKEAALQEKHEAFVAEQEAQRAAEDAERCAATRAQAHQAQNEERHFEEQLERQETLLEEKTNRASKMETESFAHELDAQAVQRRQEKDLFEFTVERQEKQLRHRRELEFESTARAKTVARVAEDTAKPQTGMEEESSVAYGDDFTEDEDGAECLASAAAEGKPAGPRPLPKSLSTSHDITGSSERDQLGSLNSHHVDEKDMLRRVDTNQGDEVTRRRSLEPWELDRAKGVREPGSRFKGIRSGVGYEQVVTGLREFHSVERPRPLQSIEYRVAAADEISTKTKVQRKMSVMDMHIESEKFRDHHEHKAKNASTNSTKRPATHHNGMTGTFSLRRRRLPLIVLVKEPPQGVLLEHVNVLRKRSHQSYYHGHDPNHPVNQTLSHRPQTGVRSNQNSPCTAAGVTQRNGRPHTAVGFVGRSAPASDLSRFSST